MSHDYQVSDGERLARITNSFFDLHKAVPQTEWFWE